MLSFCEALKSILKSPCTTFSAELEIFTELSCNPAPVALGYRLDLNKAAATGLIIAAGIRLFGKGWRVGAGIEEGVHGAVKDKHGLYNWPVPKQTPEPSKPPVQIAPKSPVRSAAVKTVLVPAEL